METENRKVIHTIFYVKPKNMDCKICLNFVHYGNNVFDTTVQRKSNNTNINSDNDSDGFIKISNENCLVCQGLKEFKDKFRNNPNDDFYLKEVNNEEKEFESVKKELLEYIDKNKRRFYDDNEYIDSRNQVNAHYERLINNLQLLRKKYNDFLAFSGKLNENSWKNELVIIKDQLTIEFYNIINQHLNCIMKDNESEEKEQETCLTSVDMLNDSVYEYSFEVNNSHLLFGGKDRFLVICNNNLYEIKNGLFHKYKIMKFRSIDLNKDGILYGMNTKLKSHEFPRFYEWDYEDKEFKENKTNFIVNTYKANSAVLFIEDEYVILFDTKLKNFKRAEYFWTVLNCNDKKIADSSIYVLREETDLRQYDLQSIDFELKDLEHADTLGEFLKVHVISREVSILKDIIEPIKAGKFLLRNDQYVFIMDHKNNSAKAYPHKNIFREGQIRAYYITDTEITFCLLKSFYPIWKFLVKSFTL